jgi:hypothetical protein
MSAPFPNRAVQRLPRGHGPKQRQPQYAHHPRRFARGAGRLWTYTLGYGMKVSYWVTPFTKTGS